MRATLSDNSLAKYLGISSPKIRITEVEIINILNSFNPKREERNRVLIEAKTTITMLLPISIVEKNCCGLLRKN
jgi:hypothetical protein